jgi:hypothetical protein
MNYDPARAAAGTRELFGRAPATLVALVAPALEVPVLSQHAIACEVRDILGSQRVHVVTIDDRPSPASFSKLDKEQSFSAPRDATGLDEALAIASGAKRGASVDPDAHAFVYAYLSDTFKRHDPFHFSALQRTILQAIASGAVVPTTRALATAGGTTAKEVNEAVKEVAVEIAIPGELAPPGESNARDGLDRVHLLVHHYGAWLRLVQSRRAGGQR